MLLILHPGGIQLVPHPPTSRGQEVSTHIMILLLGPQFLRQTLHDPLQNLVYTLLVIPVPIPHHDQVRVKPHTAAHTADVVPFLHDLLEGLPDGHHLNFFPELVGVGFGHAEGPGAAFGVAGVFPDGLDVFLEEAVGVPQGEGGEGGVVEDLPEGLFGAGGVS